MILIEEILISDSLLNQNFACDLDVCKGSCCWEGDLGAPVDEDELAIIESEYSIVQSYLDDESKQIIELGGYVSQTGGYDEYSTPLKADGRCVYMMGKIGETAKCAFEKAYEDGKTTFRKPISCHLYPIRISRSTQNNLEILNFDDWSICSGAKIKGEKDKIHVLTFARDSLIAKYGEDFYNRLEICLKSSLKNK